MANYKHKFKLLRKYNRNVIDQFNLDLREKNKYLRLASRY